MLAFSIDYYEMIFRVTQSVELFCAYYQSIFADVESNGHEVKKKIYMDKIMPHKVEAVENLLADYLELP